MEGLIYFTLIVLIVLVIAYRWEDVEKALEHLRRFLEWPWDD